MFGSNLWVSFNRFGLKNERKKQDIWADRYTINL
jgi:hypothetical protein